MNRFMNANEAADYLNISRVTFWRMRKNCEIPSVKVGFKSVRYTPEDLDSWVKGYDPQRSYMNE